MGIWDFIFRRNKSKIVEIQQSEKEYRVEAKKDIFNPDVYKMGEKENIMKTETQGKKIICLSRALINAFLKTYPNHSDSALSIQLDLVNITQDIWNFGKVNPKVIQAQKRGYEGNISFQKGDIEQAICIFCDIIDDCPSISASYAMIGQIIINLDIQNLKTKILPILEKYHGKLINKDINIIDKNGVYLESLGYFTSALFLAPKDFQLLPIVEFLKKEKIGEWLYEKALGNWKLVEANRVVANLPYNRKSK